MTEEVPCDFDEDFKETAPSDRKRFIILAIYDITDNKTRLAMVRCLEQYAVRVQKSAFEGYLTKEQYDRMRMESSAIIDPETDSLRIYLLHDHTRVISFGRGPLNKEEVIIY